MWIFAENIDANLAEEHLVQFMRSTTRQKQRAILIDLIYISVFWAVLTSAGTVLFFRLSGVTVSVISILTLALLLALITAGILARARRPDDLQVALLADIKLNLNQRLSTAWEFYQANPKSEVTARLAVQAVKQRLPLHSEPVFPIQLNVYAKLIPMAMALLVLASVIDLGRLNEPVVIEADATVVDEGKRLRAFAEQLRSVAHRERHPRSAIASEKVLRWGTRMQSGSLSRREALIGLRQLGVDVKNHRQDALYDGAMLPLEISESQITDLTRGLDRLGVQSMLRSLIAGGLSAAEAHALTLEANTLARLGIDLASLEQALENFDNGTQGNLRQILEKLVEMDIALHDASSLSMATTALQRARENLGDSRATQALHARGDTNPGLGGYHRVEVRSADSLNSPHLPSNRGTNSGYGQQIPNTFTRSQKQSSQRETEVILRAQGQTGIGDFFSAEARVRPRVDQPSVARVQLDPLFSAQLEPVLSREDYPLHHKAFIRRYFLGLSIAVDAEATTQGKPLK